MMGGILLGFVGGLFTANYIMQNKLQAKNRNNSGAKGFGSQGTEMKSPSKKKNGGKDSDPDENTKFL